MPLPTTEPDFAPSQAAIMGVDKIALHKTNEEKKLTTLKISLRGYNSAKNADIFWAYNPIFFRPGFDPKELLEFEGGQNLFAVFENNITTAKEMQVGHLLGLHNRDFKRANETYDALQAIGEVATPDQVIDILTDSLITRRFGQGFGAILKQSQKATDTPEGTKWVRTNWWNVDNRVTSDVSKTTGKPLAKCGYWKNNAEGRKKQIERAAKSTVNQYDPLGQNWFVVTFDEDGENNTPF